MMIIVVGLLEISQLRGVSHQGLVGIQLPERHLGSETPQHTAQLLGSWIDANAMIAVAEECIEDQELRRGCPLGDTTCFWPK